MADTTTVMALPFPEGSDATDVPSPGRDEAVVTDAAIKAAVQAIVAPEPE